MDDTCDSPGADPRGAFCLKRLRSAPRELGSMWMGKGEELVVSPAIREVRAAEKEP